MRPPDAPPPPDLADRFRPHRRPAFAPIVVGGKIVGTVIAEAGRPSGLLWREIGPVLALIAGVLIVGAGLLAAVMIFRPAHLRLQGLSEAARRLGAGDPVARAPESGGDEITGVAKAFNQMADGLAERAAQLQAADRARRQLLADVSHELMTPLTAIRGYLETLSMPGLRLDDVSRHRYLEIVGEETHRLEQLIGDLLELSRLEAGGGTLDMQLVPVDAIFGRVLDRHGHAAAEKCVTLEAESVPELVIHADRIRLEQALQNLAANALRHTPPGGAVRLSAERADGTIVMRVRDTGEGIAPEHLPHVFDRFYKADESRRESEGSGSGLGLSIVKAIVERHGGRVAVDSTVGEGTVFEITLPRPA
jgi:two-component system sensor histidine kinase BaeS